MLTLDPDLDPDRAVCVSCGELSEQNTGWCDVHVEDDTYVCDLCGVLTQEDPCRGVMVWCDYCGPCDAACREHERDDDDDDDDDEDEW